MIPDSPPGKLTEPSADADKACETFDVVPGSFLRELVHSVLFRRLPALWRANS